MITLETTMPGEAYVAGTCPTLGTNNNQSQQLIKAYGNFNTIMIYALFEPHQYPNVVGDGTSRLSSVGRST